jgi:hypothetical protein
MGSASIRKECPRSHNGKNGSGFGDVVDHFIYHLNFDGITALQLGV